METLDKNTLESVNTRYLKQIKKARQELKNNRKNFWKKNQVNFLNNIKTIISFFEFPEKWTVNAIASRFLMDREVMPYDPDVWSFSDVISATDDIGYNIILFFNRTDLEFLSASAILPLVVHEVAHVFQAAREPEKYVTSSVDKELNKEYEKEAEAEERKFSDEFRKQNVLEKVLYCYDKKGWKGAKKMVQFAREDVKDAFGGGYDEDLTEEEYKIFLKAEEERDIEIFIDYFIDSLKEKEEVPAPLATTE
jgi:hypothetical protein